MDDCFSCLPPEIVQKVFVHCLPTTEGWWRDRSLNMLQPTWAPVLLMHVCSRWRNLALDCSALWTNFAFNLVSYDSGLTDTDLSQKWEEISLWNRARKNALISLSVRILDRLHPHNLLSDAPARWSEHISAIVIDNAIRLQRLRLECRFVEAAAFFNLPSEKLVNLQCLDLSDMVYQDFAKASQSLSTVRSLQRLAVRLLLSYRLNDVNPTFPTWSHLRVLVLEGSTGLSFRSILQNCRNLEQLSTSVLSPDTSGPLHGGVVACNLNDLSIAFDVDSDPSFFKDISFPKLSRLRIACIEHPNTFSWGNSEHLSCHSHFLSQLGSLKTLILSFSDICGDDLLQLLPSMPQLERLVVDSELQTYTSFLTGLIFTPEKPFLAKLRDFKLCIDLTCASTYPSFEKALEGLGPALFQMIQSHLSSSGSTTSDCHPEPLQRVQLIHTDHPVLNDIIDIALNVPPEVEPFMAGVDFRVQRGIDESAWAPDEIVVW